MSLVYNNSTKNAQVILSSSNLAIGNLIFSATGKQSILSIKRQNDNDASITNDGKLLINYRADWYLLTIYLSGISPSLTAANHVMNTLNTRSWEADVDASVWVANPDTRTFWRLTGCGVLQLGQPFGDLEASGMGEVPLTIAVKNAYDSGLKKVADVLATITGVLG